MEIGAIILLLPFCQSTNLSSDPIKKMWLTLTHKKHQQCMHILVSDVFHGPGLCN